MKLRRSALFSLALLTAILAPAVGSAQASDPLTTVGQASADEIRRASGADLALVAAGLFREKSKLDANDLAANLIFPEDEILTLELTGAQLRKAFERSLLLYPQSNDAAFLYISGGTVTFDGKAASGSRVTAVNLDAGFDPARKYKVATTASLARGALGYFKVWDEKNLLPKSNPTLTIESVLRGKRGTPGASRWLLRG